MLTAAPCAGKVHTLKAKEIQKGAFQNTILEEGVIKLSPGPSIQGIFVLSQEFGENEKKALELDWIDGISIRTTWAKVEPEKDAYNWELFDSVVAHVKASNARTGKKKTVQLRIMDGVWSPAYLEKIGVRWIDALPKTAKKEKETRRVPCAIDNPILIERLRKLYIAAADRYKKDQDVVDTIHGTWLGGLWSEIWVPDELRALPGYSSEKMLDTMKGIIDLFIEEIIGKGYVTELPFSGIYDKDKIKVTVLADYIAQKLGKHTPWFHINDCSVGQLWYGKKPIYDHVKTVLNVGYQMQGANNWETIRNGKTVYMSGDYLDLLKTKRPVTDVKPYYMEIYTADLFPKMDTKHRIEEACMYFREFLKTLPPLREKSGAYTYTVDLGKPDSKIESISVDHDSPEETGVQWQVRRYASVNEQKSASWAGPGSLPAATGRFLDIRLTLTTDNCKVSPSVKAVRILCR